MNSIDEYKAMAMVLPAIQRLKSAIEDARCLSNLMDDELGDLAKAIDDACVNEAFWEQKMRDAV